MVAGSAASGAADPRLVATAKWASLAYAGAMLLLWAWMGSVDDPGPLLFLAVCFVWQVAPLLAVALMTRASGTRRGQVACLLFGAFLIASTVAAYIYCLFIAPDPQLPIFLLLVWPLYQLGAFVLFLVAALVSGWSERGRKL